MPFLRLYGYLDGLVPRKVVPMLDKLWPHSESYIFAKAAHAPFISHPVEFCHLLVAFDRGKRFLKWRDRNLLARRSQLFF